MARDSQAASAAPAMVRANVLGFVLVLCLGGLLFWITPRHAISADEKRQLAQPAVLTATTLFDGSYERKTEEFYNDNFPGRDRWIELANRMKRLRGFGGGGIQVVTRPDENEQALNAPRDGKFTPANEEFRKIRSVIVVGDRAVQRFGGTNSTLTPFLGLVHRYHERLGPDVRIYVLSNPVGSDFYLPYGVNDGVLREKENIDHLYSKLDPGVVPVRAYEEMVPHRSEYIQFRTDHHWTGLGAYYAYRAFARSAGFVPLELNQMTRSRTQGTYLGTLYSLTRSPELGANPDIVEYWKIPGETKTTVFHSGYLTGAPGSLYHENAHGGDSYGVFLGGDFPLMRIETGRHSGRKLLMIKDSFGNALAPYLCAHYDEVFVVDYRYFKGSIPEVMQHYGIGELLYAHNTFFTNSLSTVTRGDEMLGGVGK